MKFTIEIDAEVTDHDADIVLQVPEVIVERFRGTAVKIGAINIIKENG